jgi:hypothetical protein
MRGFFYYRNGRHRCSKAPPKRAHDAGERTRAVSSRLLNILLLQATLVTQSYVSTFHFVSSGIWAAPGEKDVLRWEFVILGSDDTPYEGGLYHGRLHFPTSFPMAPPGITMITPSGRFETNKKIWYPHQRTGGTMPSSLFHISQSLCRSLKRWALY